jgi:ribose transport system permease protein
MLSNISSFLIKFIRFREGGLIAIIIVLGIMLSIFGGKVSYKNDAGEIVEINKFLSPSNLDKLVKNTSFFAIMAIGVTIVIISGGIDLSVGSIYCLSAVCGAIFFNHFGPGPQGDREVPLPFLIIIGGMLICFVVGTLCGFLNGFMINLLKLHPFIITLGTMAIYRGIAFIMTKAQAYTFFPPQFTDGLIRYKIGENIYPIPMLIMVLSTIAGIIFLSKMVIGRYIYAVGGNELASKFSGINLKYIKTLVYSLSGLTCGIAAMIMLGYYGSASSDVGKGYELDVIAASVVGGASLSGGYGSILGSVLGALIIQMINNGIIILGIDQNYSQVIIGGVIIIAVFFDQISAILREKQLKSGVKK